MKINTKKTQIFVMGNKEEGNTAVIYTLLDTVNSCPKAAGLDLNHVEETVCPVTHSSNLYGSPKLLAQTEQCHNSARTVKRRTHQQVFHEGRTSDYHKAISAACKHYIIAL